MARVVKVIFYETIIGGQDTVATISYNGKKYTHAGDKNLLGAFPPETEDPETIYEAMQGAPAKYDGRMLRAEYVDSTKGGDGSGHHDHTGLPGVWGGSRSTGRADDAEEEPRSTASAAKDVRSAAEKAEPGTTKDILAVAKEHDAEMFQLDKRLKAVPSIKRRIEFLMENRNQSLDEATDGLVDKIRYTMVFDDDVYIDKASLVFDSLESLGWIEDPRYSENYWESGIGFEGLSYVFRKGNRALELQFHTPSAAKILPESHRLYEIWREMEDGPARDAIEAKMYPLWDTVAPPLGWETARGMKIGR